MHANVSLILVARKRVRRPTARKDLRREAPARACQRARLLVPSCVSCPRHGPRTVARSSKLGASAVQPTVASTSIGRSVASTLSDVASVQLEAPTDADSAALLVERCRALLRLRASLGVHYARRKQTLLTELLGAAASLERCADALSELRGVGFLESDEELARWADELLSEERARGVVDGASNARARTR